LNIVLFPPLFFFTALYYTDVVSTEVVVWAYCLSMNHILKKMPVLRGVIIVLIGVLALLFRQTNVFWVGVFSGALDAVDALTQAVAEKRRQGGPKNTIMPDQNSFAFVGILDESIDGIFVYDPPIHDAFLEGTAQCPSPHTILSLTSLDYLISAVSIVLASIRNFRVIITAVLPQMLILSAFASFVYWNSGVVLGDKSNHVATIHTPQMLYIWPYILFFSFPVVLPIAIRRLLGQCRAISNTRAHPSGSGLFLVYLGTRTLYTLAFIGVALLAVHYNTIVHPFTLADNRHYVFYIFRILRWHWAIKYLAAPVYIVCAYLALATLGGSAKIGALKSEGGRRKTAKDTPESVAALTAAASSTTRTSFALVWLTTTTLALISAPLVEPRYYIISWIMWRMHVLPYASPSPAIDTPSAKEKVALAKRRAKIVLWAETLWLLLINSVTGYVFLYKGFEWPQEPGAVQRFMW
jgi:alpha-1,2-glucosyltransferase